VQVSHETSSVKKQIIRSSLFVAAILIVLISSYYLRLIRWVIAVWWARVPVSPSGRRRSRCNLSISGWRVAQLSAFSLPVLKLWVPRPCVLCKGGYDAAYTIGLVMPSGLHRTYGAHHLHFITCSCYRRLPFLRTARSRDIFLTDSGTDP
jgi:hypothetical protein